jgi:hypothetical protein
MFRFLVAAAALAGLTISFGSPAEAQYQVTWRQVGGPWSNGPYNAKQPICTNNNARAACNGQSGKGAFRHGQVTLLWRDGCDRPPITMQCEAKAGTAAGTPAAAPSVATPAGNSACPRGETPLRVTGLCPSAAQEGFLSKPKTPAYREKGCRWVVNETAMPGNEALLYLAQRCGNETASLALSGNAKAPMLIARTKTFGEDVKMSGYPVDPNDSKRTINQIARAAIQEPNKARLCAATEQKDGQRIVVAMPPGEARKFIPDGPTGGLCGAFGQNDDASHWRVFGGMAWYFQLGQDMWQSIDTDNVAVLRRYPSGGGMNGWRLKY